MATSRIHGHGAVPPPLTVSGSALDDPQFTRAQLARLLPEQPALIAKIADSIARAEEVHGDGDGMLEPRHAAHASQDVRAVMSAVYEIAGKKTLSIEAIEGHLPEALVDLLGGNSAPTSLVRLANRHLLEGLAADYRASVLLGGKASANTFFKAHGIGHEQWKSLEDGFPALFPAPSSVGAAAWRLDALATLYQQVIDGEMSRNLFCKRTGVSLEDLQRLQQDDPERFPPAKGAPHGGVTASMTALSSVWSSVVVARKGGIEAFLAKTGLTKSALDLLREEHADLFPPPGTALPLATSALTEKYAHAVGASAKKTLARDPLARVEDIVAAFNLTSSAELTVSRYYNIRAKYPDEFPALLRGSGADDLIANTAKSVMAKDPTTSRADLLAAVTDKVGALKPWRLRSVAALGATAETQAHKGRGNAVTHSWRSTHPVVSLYRLAAMSAAPGTAWSDVVARVDEVLAERGLPGSGGKDVNRKLIFGDGPSYELAQARVASEIVAEYAAVAKKGAGEGEILAQLVSDYPALLSFHFAKFKKLWLEAPKNYPALDLHGGKLHLAGAGKKIDAPRFVGGWDPVRAVVPKEKKALEALADLTDAARIDVSLPLLDQAVARVGGKQPLEKTNILWVTHLLGNTFPLGRALAAAGATGNRVNVVGSPYGSTSAVADALRTEGFQVDVPALSEEAYKSAVKKALDRTIALHEKNHQPIVVVDDGGLVAQILHGDPKYKPILGSVRIVEQTTRGIISAEENALETPIINVARSESKACEAEFIGRMATTKLLQALTRTGHSIEGKEFTIMSYGLVGRALAQAAQAMGAKVTICEPSKARAQEAFDAGFAVKAPKDAIEGADIVVGASGKQSLPLELLKLLKPGAVIASASSKRSEFDMAGLEKIADATVIPPSSPTLRLPSKEYDLAGKKITVIGDGWPLNFDGDVMGLPADEIEVTLAALFLGAVQAAGHGAGNKGVVPFEDDAWLLDTFKKGRADKKEPTPISNPDDWTALISRLGGAPSEKQAMDLDTRFRLRDRSLASEIAQRWDEQPAYVPVTERLEAMLGAPVTFQQWNKLRASHGDLLGDFGGKQEMSPKLLQRLAKMLAAEGRPSLDVIAEKLNLDDEFTQAKPLWTRATIKYVVKSNPSYFG